MAVLMVSLGAGSLLTDAQGQVEQRDRDRGAGTREITPTKRILTPKIFPSSVPAIDGNLDDLINYVRLLADTETGCALEISDPDSDVVVTQDFEPCSPLTPVAGGFYFENGFDQELALIAFDGQDFHLGMRVMGTIGDPDGNGSPDTDCGTNILDSPGIGVFESYKWFIDSNCDGQGDIIVIVNNNQVAVSGVAYDNASFAFNGSDVEVLIEGVDIIPQFRARAFAGSDVDGLSEDLSDEMECAPLTPTMRSGCLRGPDHHGDDHGSQLEPGGPGPGGDHRRAAGGIQLRG
jgi:hypothetical protein